MIGLRWCAFDELDEQQNQAVSARNRENLPDRGLFDLQILWAE